MGRSRAQCAADRLADREAGIRQALAIGDVMAALWIAVKGLVSEAKKLWQRRSGDGALTIAELAGMLLTVQAGLHEYRPMRPLRCPEVPRPDDMLAMFEDGLRRHAQEGAV